MLQYVLNKDSLIFFGPKLVIENKDFSRKKKIFFPFLENIIGCKWKTLSLFIF